MPVYQPLIPSGTVNLDVDYQNIQDNFNQANVVYGIDHYAFDNSSSNEGFHQKVTLPNSSNPTTTAAQGIVYTKNSTTNAGRTDLYYAYQTDVGTAMTGLFFPLNGIKAWGRADISGLLSGTGFNVKSVSFSSNTWTITLDNAVTDNANKMMVLATATSNTGASSLGVKNLGLTTFDIIRSASDASQIMFAVIAFG